MKTVRDRLWEKAGGMCVPLTGAFELLPICNLSCKMCYVRKSKSYVDKHGGLIRAKQWLEYAKAAYNKGLLFPLLSGGEPLLHPDFKEIFEGMQEMGMQVSVNTNGTLIDEDMAIWFSQHVPTRINLTLYGASEETYEKLCGSKDAFLKVKNAVKLLKKYNIPLKFNASITPDNFEDLDKIMAFAKESHTPIQVATYMFPPVRRDASMIGKNHRLDPNMAGYAKVKVDYLQGEPQWFMSQAMRFSHFVDLKDIDFNQEPEGHLLMRCKAGYSSFWIDWQGNMCNCGMYSSSTHSLKDMSFEDAWELIRKETKEVKCSTFCSICPNRYLCHTCVAMVYNECDEQSNRPEYLCEMNQAAAYYYKQTLSVLKERGELYENVELKESADFDISMLYDCEL